MFTVHQKNISQNKQQSSSSSSRMRMIYVTCKSKTKDHVKYVEYSNFQIQNNVLQGNIPVLIFLKKNYFLVK